MGGLANRDLARKLRDAPSELSRELRAEMRKAAGPAVRRAQRAIRGASSHHPGSLRAEIAGTVSASTSIRQAGATVTIKSDGEKMPPGKANLPAYADATRRPYNRWRHPVFGRSDDPWVTQEWPSARGWFDSSIRAELSSFAKAAQEACDKTAAKINGEG